MKAHAALRGGGLSYPDHWWVRSFRSRTASHVHSLGYVHGLGYMDSFENNAITTEDFAIQALVRFAFERLSPRKGSSASSWMSVRMRRLRSGGIASSCFAAARWTFTCQIML
jgi:hypothetical protein